MGSQGADDTDAAVYARRAVFALDEPPELVSWLEEDFGAALRAAFVYEGGTVRFVHLRDDVRAAYSDAEFHVVADEMLFAASIEDYQKRGLYRLGDRTIAVDGFDEGFVVRVPVGDDRGVGFSVDADATVPLPDYAQEIRENAPLP